MDSVFPYSQSMSRKFDADKGAQPASKTAQVLGKNLGALMESHPNLSSNPKLASKTGLGTGTLSRLRNGEVDATVSTLEKLAVAFELEPWQLLVPRMDPGNPPALLNATEAEMRLWERLRDVAKDIKGSS